MRGKRILCVGGMARSVREVTRRSALCRRKSGGRRSGFRFIGSSRRGACRSCRRTSRWGGGCCGLRGGGEGDSVSGGAAGGGRAVRAEVRAGGGGDAAVCGGGAGGCALRFGVWGWTDSDCGGEGGGAGGGRGYRSGADSGMPGERDEG